MSSILNPEMDRKEAIVSAYTEIARHPVYLDTETTGLAEEDEILEICILESDGNVLLESLVKPRGHISEEAYWVHRITKRMVKGAPTWEQIAPQVAVVLSRRRVASFNADFDLRMLKQTNALHDFSWQIDECAFFCVMKLYARFYGKVDGGGRDYRWQGLRRAARQCGIEHGKIHRAREDTRLTRALLKHMASFYIVHPPKAILPPRLSLLRRWLARLCGF